MKRMQQSKSLIMVLLVCLTAFVEMQCAGKGMNQSSNQVANQDSNNNQNQRSDNRAELSSDFKSWSLRSEERGGIDGRCRAFAINSERAIIYEDCRAKTSASMETDNPPAFAEIEDLLRRLDLPHIEPKAEEKPLCAGCTDQVNSSFTIKLDERAYNPSALNFSSAQTAAYQRLQSIYQEIREKNENELRIRAAERQAAEQQGRNAKSLSLYVTDEKSKTEWEGNFTRTGDGNIFEGEWKNQKSGEAVQDQLEVMQNGLAVKTTRKGADQLALPKEFDGYMDSMRPGMMLARYPPTGFQWYAIFR